MLWNHKYEKLYMLVVEVEIMAASMLPEKKIGCEAGGSGREELKNRLPFLCCPVNQEYS